MNMMSTINDWSFPVEMMPTPNAVTGEPEPDAFQVVRTDTNTVLGHHGSRYKLVPHDDVVNSIMDAVKQSDITTDYKEPTISVFENGRKMRGEILFPDLTICFILLWSIQKPKTAPTTLLMLIFLTQDILFYRPIGLYATSAINMVLYSTLFEYCALLNMQVFGHSLCSDFLR